MLTVLAEKRDSDKLGEHRLEKQYDLHAFSSCRFSSFCLLSVIRALYYNVSNKRIRALLFLQTI